jgi:hypothetical protein
MVQAAIPDSTLFIQYIRFSPVTDVPLPYRVHLPPISLLIPYLRPVNQLQQVELPFDSTDVSFLVDGTSIAGFSAKKSVGLMCS